MRILRLASQARWGRVAAGAMLLALASVGAVRLRADAAAAPRLDWLFDSRVTSTARIGNTLYVGGWFTTMRPASAPLANHFHEVNPATGGEMPSIIPPANGSVTAITPDNAGGYYIAGAFSNIGTNRVVHILASGAVDPAFNVPGAIVGTISALVRVGPSLVAGGTFLHVDGVFRPLFAMDPATGALSSWAPILPGGDIIVRDVEVVGGLLIVLSRNGNGTTRFVTAYDAVSGNEVWQTDVTGAPGQFAPGAMGLSGGRLIVGIGRLYSLDPLTGVIDPAWAAGQPITEGLFAMAVSPTAIYVGGTFQSFWGQPRGRLAAVDPATGTLLPWSPQATTSGFESGFIGRLAISPAGTVLAASNDLSRLTINGQIVGVLAEIDTAGTLTPWRVAAPIEGVELLQVSASNTVFVSGFSGYVGQVNRTALAAFDLTTNTLLPQTITIAGAIGPTVDGLVASGNALHMRGYFESINGVARAGVATVDTTTNNPVTWPASGLAVQGIVTAGGGWEYVSVAGALRRIQPVTGVLDTAWQAPQGASFEPADGGVTFAALEFPGNDGIYGSPGSGTAFGSLDPITGRFIERRRTGQYFGATGSVVRLMGGTAFVMLPIGGVAGPSPGRAVLAFDTTTFASVSAPPVAGLFSSFDVGGGRLFVAGTNIGIGTDVRYGAHEVQLPGAFTSWDSGFRTHTGFGFPAAVKVWGDVVAATGTYASDRWRVAVFTVNGAQTPTNLRAHATGADTVFTWDAVTPAPPGGYVIEGGFAPGRAAAALAVGNATSVALPMPAGPIFVRVRPQGSTEVSNEVVAGCVAPPLPPTALTTTLSGINLTLVWTAPSGPVTGYTLLAGTSSGLSDAATLALGPQTSVAGPVPGGTFFARVTASNACGTSGPSGEVFFTIGAPDALPAAPSNLTSTVTGSTLTLSWSAPAGPVTGYVLEAGSAPGLANIGAATIGATTSFVIPGVPPGVYYVRVRAISSAGSGAPSSDVAVVVP